MTSIVLNHAKNAKGEHRGVLVLRRHDLSGTDYERLGSIGIETATVLGRDGIAVLSRDAPGFRGVPGVVFSEAPPPYVELLDVRTDVADPTTTVKTVLMHANVSREVLGQMRSGRIDWLYGEPAEMR